MNESTLKEKKTLGSGDRLTWKEWLANFIDAMRQPFLLLAGILVLVGLFRFFIS